MDEDKEYFSTDRMSDLISSNSQLLMVMSRFGISLGFGEKSVKEICEEQTVDCQTFLAVANYITNGHCRHDAVSLPSLIDYLKRAHVYFLDFKLPLIRRKLIEAIDCSTSNDAAFLILKFYDMYVTEVHRHMEYEDKTVFAYVESLLSGTLNPHYSIAEFSAKHNHIETKLKELKDIIIRYYPERGNDLLNAVLFDIMNCEEDLTSHCSVEDHLFVPAVATLEKQLRLQGGDAPSAREEEEAAEDGKLDTLSQREKEIIVCVAKGMSNKEIAEELCLSINTVTTHRRNISTKLQIHTPAGLTIFAIVKKLVSLQEIQLN